MSEFTRRAALSFAAAAAAAGPKAFAAPVVAEGRAKVPGGAIW